MNNKSLNEFQLQDLYVTGAMKMLRLQGEHPNNGQLKPYELWAESMTPIFPEGLEPEDFDAFIDRGMNQINDFFEAALERLRA